MSWVYSSFNPSLSGRLFGRVYLQSLHTTNRLSRDLTTNSRLKSITKNRRSRPNEKN
jgi:hypothetical protein